MPCSLAIPSLLEMLGEHQHILLASLFQPRPREPMPERPIPVREHRIRPLPEKRVPERHLLLAGKTALRALDQHLPLDKLPDPFPHLRGALREAEQRSHAPAPEGLPEKARCPEDQPRLLV